MSSARISAPRARVLEFFEDHRTAAVGGDESITIAIPRSRRLGGTVVALRKRLGLREATDAESRRRHFAAACDDDVSVAVLDRPEAETDRVGRGGARRDDPEIRPLETVADRQVPRNHVDDRGRNEKRRDLARSVGRQEGVVLGFDGRESTDTRAGDDPATLDIMLAEVDPGMGHGLDARRHAVVHELVHATGFFRRDVVTDREAAHGTADTGGEGAGVEAGDETNAALATQHRIPCTRDGAADRRDDSKTGDDDSTLAHGSLTRCKSGDANNRGRLMAGPEGITLRTTQALRRAVT